ncbi:winged helix-turn-helix transcriptional regulator [Saccharopolyspora sp. NPDC000995]
MEPGVVWALRRGPLSRLTCGGGSAGSRAKGRSETLRRLQYNDLVDKCTYREAPPRVEYRLTDLGKSLLGPVEALGEWGFRISPRRRSRGSARNTTARRAPERAERTANEAAVRTVTESFARVVAVSG